MAHSVGATPAPQSGKSAARSGPQRAHTKRPTLKSCPHSVQNAARRREKAARKSAQQLFDDANCAPVADPRIFVHLPKDAHPRTVALAHELIAVLPAAVLRTSPPPVAMFPETGTMSSAAPVANNLTDAEDLERPGKEDSARDEIFADTESPTGEESADAPPTHIHFTEDVGPQFITFQTAARQLVFKLIAFRARSDMGLDTVIRPEASQLVLNNFVSALGLSVAEFLMGMFPINLESNQVANFTVHKDFLFFRLYRFCFRPAGLAMENIGPHLTLRLWRMSTYANGRVETQNFKKYVKNLNLL